MSGLWDQAIGKRDGGMKGDKGGLVPQVGNLWDSAIGQGKKREKVRDKNNFRLFGGSNTTKPAVDWGPGGALGIGCGAGVGVGLTGGTGIGATPWSSLRFVFGVGAGCGIGVGYGYGFGLGVRWDKPPQDVPKRVVIEL
ncbi:uncharacterized protein [Physcomitrium patens]|nr:fibroin heavy chain-like isoform X3 [Physcomitrium patens]|eukprot:XP_024364174.1 fibroin heavy chain-like isoform X3 [Physcomitrella patens]